VALNKKRNLNWIIVAGGTGGHLFPGIAIGEELAKMGRKVSFVTGTRDVENYIFRNLSFKRWTIEAEGFIGRSTSDKMRALAKLIKSVKEAVKIIREERPDIVFATGGYASVPVIFAARSLFKKTGLHEQNSIPGVANRLLAKMSHRVFVSIEESKTYFPSDKVIFSGNPVRSSLLERLRVYEKKDKKGKCLLILGGSQGAKKINEVCVKVVTKLIKEFKDLRVIHQTGTKFFEDVLRKYEELVGEEKRIEVKGFIDDMAEAYAQADLVITRAGATTLAELFAAGLPAIFIPFPYATHNHQEKNAEVVVKKGGGILLRERDLTEEALFREIKELLANEEKRKKMSRVMKSMFVKDSAKVIIREMEGLLRDA